MWIVQVLSTTRASTLMHANPTARQRVDCSSPFYNTSLNTYARESHSAAACGSFKSFLQHERSPANQKSHSAAACGSFRSFLQHERSQANQKSHSAAACGWFKSFLQHERSQANQKSHSAARTRRRWGGAVHRKDLKDPHAAALWDFRVVGERSILEGT